MANLHVAWVLLGAGSRVDGPQNCIRTVVSSETVSTPGASGFCPNGANAAICRAVDAAMYVTKGTSSSSTTGVYVSSGGAEVFHAEPGVTKIAGANA